MKGSFALTTSTTSQASAFFFWRFLIKYVLRAKKLRLSKEISGTGCRRGMYHDNNMAARVQQNVTGVSVAEIFNKGADGFLYYILGRLHFLSKMSAFESEK